ncbi:hypothetical protein FQN60_009867, partial [Etheostoma spectabile]
HEALVSSCLRPPGFHWSGRVPAVVPESCLLIMVGLLVGGVIYGVRHSAPPTLSAKAFFLFLLPPIVLDAGYFLPGKLFFENLGTILWYAVLGTLWNVLGIGLSLYGVCLLAPGSLGDISLLHCLLFGSLIAAVDPVAVLSVFQEMHVNDQLHILVFGESLLNDAVTVVLYKLFESFLRLPSVSGLDVLLGGCRVFVVGLGGLFVGFFFGLLAALTSRFTYRAQVIAPLFVFLYSYLSYLTSEMLHLSGIMAIQYFLKMWSSVSETLIFIFLGVSTIQDVHMWSWSFVCSTLLLCLVWRATDQFIIAYGGLRGAICFSLVFLIDDFPKKRLFITTTIVVILFTVFVQGMTIKPLVELLDVKRKKRALPTVSEEIHSRLIDHLLAGIEDVVGYWGQHYWKDKFEQFNKKYLRRFLIHEDHQAPSSILRVYQELERRDQRGDEEAPPLVDPRSQSRPLLPEEMDSIRRILSRNLQNFNNKQTPAYSRHTLHQDATMDRTRKPLYRHQSLGERSMSNTQWLTQSESRTQPVSHSMLHEPEARPPGVTCPGSYVSDQRAGGSRIFSCQKGAGLSPTTSPCWKNPEETTQLCFGEREAVVKADWERTDSEDKKCKPVNSVISKWLHEVISTSYLFGHVVVGFTVFLQFY